MMKHGFRPNEVNRKISETEEDDGMMFILYEPWSGQAWTLLEKGKFGVFREKKIIGLEYSIHGVEIITEDNCLYFIANAPYVIKYSPPKMDLNEKA